MDVRGSDEVSGSHIRSRSKTGLCEACMCNKKEIIAVLYCLDCGDKFCECCGNWHRTSKLSKDHRLSKVEEAPPSDVVQMIQKLNICPNHPSEKVIFFCAEEDKLCCNQCAITDHRKCNHLYTIEQCVQQHYAPEKATPPSKQFVCLDANRAPIYTEIKSQVKIEELNVCYKRISDGLLALKNEMEALIKHEASLQAELTRSPDQVKALIRDVHAKIESAFSTLEKQLMDQCQTKLAELMLISQKKQLTVRSIESKIKNNEDNLKKMKQHGKNQHMFLLCHELNTMLKDIQDESKNLAEKSMTVIGIEQKTSTDQIVNSILNMIQISSTGFDIKKHANK